MQNEQTERFESIRKLVDEATKALSTVHTIAFSMLTKEQNDSAEQGESLQRIQQQSGTIVQALTEVSEIARHARSYQAQVHQSHHPETRPH